MEIKIEEQIKKDMSSYMADEFKIYMADAGWEYWMNEYTDAEDGEPCTEVELREIEKMQQKLWDEVFSEND